MNHTLRVVEAGDRLAFFLAYLKGKKVLHVGCTDHPRFNPAANLHLQLAAGELKELHGYDVDKAGLDVLRAHINAPLFSNLADVRSPYDVVLVPEVLEHVLNAGEFLNAIMAIEATEIIIMAPNAPEIVRNNAGLFGWRVSNGERIYQETVHADHCCYYSPMTLATTVSKAIATYHPGKWTIKGLFAANISTGCILMHPRPVSATGHRQD